MKKLLLLSFALASLAGCVRDETPTIFEHPQYAYVVNVSPKTSPQGLVAFDITYLDEKGVTQSKTITESWYYVVPAKKGFVMKLTSKLVLAPGATKPTSGKVSYYIGEGIAGAENDKPLSGFYKTTVESMVNVPYTVLNADLDEAVVRSYEYEIKPILEPGMSN